MYSEAFRHKKISTFKGILYVICIVALFIIVSVLARLIAYAMKWSFVDYILYLILIIIGTVIIKTKIQDYIYTLNGGTLMLERELGTRTKLLVSIPLNRVLWKGKYNELPEQYSGIGFSKVTFQPKKETYCIVYNNEGKVAAVGFSPTDVLIEKIENWKPESE